MYLYVPLEFVLENEISPNYRCSISDPRYIVLSFLFLAGFNQSRYAEEKEEELNETFDAWADRIAQEYETKRKVYAANWGHAKNAPKRTGTFRRVNLTIADPCAS